VSEQSIVTSSNTKVYIEIVNKIRELVAKDGLLPGDKIPSERELSDQLKVGRSSVREGLRALELLGLIETRRGEGTFIKNFGNHQFVDLIGTFILQGNKKVEDLLETKFLLERESIRLACSRISEEQLHVLEQHIIEKELTFEFLMKTVVEATNNLLLVRIWLIINEYHRLSETNKMKTFRIDDITQLVNDLKERDTIKAIQTYDRISSGKAPKQINS